MVTTVTIRQASPSSTSKKNHGLNLSLNPSVKPVAVASGNNGTSGKIGQVGKPNLSLAKPTQRGLKPVATALAIPVQRPGPLSSTLVTKPELTRTTPLPLTSLPPIPVVPTPPAPPVLTVPNPAVSNPVQTGHCRV